jgi:hypothetical protein
VSGRDTRITADAGPSMNDARAAPKRAHRAPCGLHGHGHTTSRPPERGSVTDSSRRWKMASVGILEHDSTAPAALASSDMKRCLPGGTASRTLILEGTLRARQPGQPLPRMPPAAWRLIPSAVLRWVAGAPPAAPAR